MSAPFVRERLPAGELVSTFMEVLQAAEEESVHGDARLEQVVVEFPMELELDVSDGVVRAVRASPPTQRTETTVMPVFHRLSLRGEVEYGG